MNPLYGEIRDCIDSFVDDLARVVSDAIHQQVRIELDRLSLTASGLSSLERKKTRGPSRTRASNGAGTEPRSPKRRGRKRSSDQLELALAGDESKSAKRAAEAEAPPAPPPPLFVHKRTREGKIHHLSRVANGEEEAPRTNGAANP